MFSPLGCQAELLLPETLGCDYGLKCGTCQPMPTHNRSIQPQQYQSCVPVLYQSCTSPVPSPPMYTTHIMEASYAVPPALNIPCFVATSVMDPALFSLSGLDPELLDPTGQLDGLKLCACIEDNFKIIYLVNNSHSSSQSHRSHTHPSTPHQNLIMDRARLGWGRWCYLQIMQPQRTYTDMHTRTRAH